MKWLSEFDNIKTPESWIEDTLSMAADMEKGDRKRKGNNKNVNEKRHFSSVGTLMKAAAIVCVFAAVSVGSVYAYNYYTARYAMTNTATSLNHFDGGTDAQGNQYAYDVAQKVNATAVSDQDAIIVQATDMVTESHKAVIQFTVKTKDDSPLVYNDETKVSFPARQQFKTIQVTVGEEQVHGGISSVVWAQRVDDADVPSEAVFELTIEDENIDFTGKDINVSLTDYQDSWAVMEDLGFSFDSVADIVAVGKLADRSEFERNEEKNYYADGSSKISYVLKPGSQKIAFSTKYPDAYIDNMGFGPLDEYVTKAAFYMTIVPGKDAERLQRLAFLNMTTGRMYNSQRDYMYKLLPDGRIQIVLSVNEDSQYSKTNDGIFIDATAKHLKNYRLVLNNPDNEATSGTRYSGTWSMTVKADASRAVADKTLKDIDMPKESVEQYQVYRINSVTLTATKFKMEYMMTEEGRTEEIKENSYFSKLVKSIVIVMKDGSRITLGNKIGGGYSDREDNAELEALLPAFIDTDNVLEIEIGGCTFSFE